MSLVDTHCHLNFHSYDDDREQVLRRAAEAKVTRVINPAIDLESSREVVRLAARFDEVYAAVGIHPNSSVGYKEKMLDEVQRLAASPKAVAIGEIGLDYYRDKSPKSDQLAAFEAQLDLATRLELPVIIHNRDASEDVIAILERWISGLPTDKRMRPGVMHSFSATWAIAERALAAGFYLGFTGPVTYKNADEMRNVAAQVPLERILVETDGPFLTPVPHRGERNEPAYIPYIVERLAAIHQVNTEEMGQATTANAVRLFGLPENT